jgi:hypothetical protein
MVAKFSELSDEKLNSGRIISAGVGIKQGEMAAIEKLAKRYSVTKNALMRLAIRSWLKQVRDGEFDIAQHVHFPPAPSAKVVIPGEIKTEE